ncbi:zinc-dependent alcohol dehydrogenase family protein [Pectobacterium sp. B2J-2]|uniref:zinc-dependent alcohol dehydrogenase family protein n=1 Tax=Pectobacterium sp. B2J-2 TaxID=3385372 RepID=UPI0038FC16C6
MTTVKLGYQSGIDHLQFAESESLVTPATDEICIQIEASSLNQHDLNVVIGHLPSQPGRILLTDAAGTVTETGSGVSEFSVGDRVISCFFPGWNQGQQPIPGFSTTPGDGVDGYARSYVSRPASWFTRAPRHLTSIEAATLPTAALTAWRALFVEGAIKAGDTVLILGTGGVSLFALQFALAAGARVIATTSSEEKVQRLLALGAETVINYLEAPEWGKTVARVTGGGADLTVEIGGPGTLAQSIQATRVGGTIAMIGVLTGVQGQVPTAMLMARQQKLQGIMVGSRHHQSAMIADLERCESLLVC